MFTNLNQWRYVDTTKNPADYATRGLCASDILSANWLSGPKFLWKEEVYEEFIPTIDLLVGDPEVKAAKVLVTRSNDCAEMLDRFLRFSSWTTLLKVVSRIKRLGSKRKSLDVVTAKEPECAVKAVIKLVQQLAFSQEIKVLQAEESLPHSNPLFNLDPILREGILCVGGRLKYSSLSEEFKHPFILPKDSYITQLILLHYHSQICHQGKSQTQMELRTNGLLAVASWLLS